MENKLGCAIVRDLLPLYADDLVSEETRAAVDGHLEGCEDCSEHLRNIRSELNAKDHPESERKNVDFLKKVRTKGRKRTVITTVIGILIVLVGISLIYYTGTAAQSADISYQTYVDGNTVTMVMKAASDTQRISRVSFTSANGMVNVIVYTTPKLFFGNQEKSYSYTLDSFDVTEVHIGNTTLWQGGTAISEKSSSLYRSLHAYVGDMPADVQTASILGVGEQFGHYSNELHTERVPYGWTLILDDTVPEAKAELSVSLMRADSCIFLALIGNLDYVEWQYSTERGAQTFTFTAEDAAAFCGTEIKQAVQSAADMQHLLDMLGVS